MQENKAFKTNDIRGIYPIEINDNLAYLVGKAIVYKYKPKKLVIGRDARASSPLLFSSIVKGILESGCEIIDIGLTSTPLFYYSVGETKADFGIMITASHNPGKYNGFKLVKKGLFQQLQKKYKSLKK
jgi:phosphomannomutase